VHLFRIEKAGKYLRYILIEYVGGMNIMEEQLRKELLMAVANVLGEEQANKLEMAFTVVLYKYEINNKQTELVVYDDSNTRIVKNYVANLRLEGKSEKTIDQYYRIINNFLKSVGKNIKEINTGDIRFFLAKYLTDRKVQKSTLDNQRRALSAFFTWLATEEYIDKNPMLRIKKIKVEQKIKKAFSDTELEQLREKAVTDKEKALIEFLVSSGCRVTEVSLLHVQDIDFNKNECVVYGKGNKERKVYLTDKCMFYLMQYLSARNEVSTSLFTNRNHYGMTKGNIETLLKKIGKRAGVANVHPHRFRRTFATNAINKGMPVQYVQKILGHKSLNTTMIYCNLDDDNIKMEHRRVA